jgi:hypothetical protein
VGKLLQNLQVGSDVHSCQFVTELDAH